jgi:predicted transcriptional regulator
MDNKILNETNTLDSNINSTKNRKLNWQDISIEDRCNMAEELTSIYIAFTNIALGLDGYNPSNQYSIGAPVKGMDVITTMIKIKVFSRTDSNTPWITLNQIINHIRRKGGMYSDVSRDTINRRINRLVRKGEISKIIISDLKESEIKKIVHHRSFKYVYSASERAIKALRKGEFSALQTAPLDTFLVHIKNFINLLPNDERVKVINQLISQQNIL